jgi:ketosteroid isomerase-like protein
MSIEANRATALQMIEKLATGVIDDAIVTEDVTWWVPGRGIIDRKSFGQIATAVQSQFKSGILMQIKGTTAEADRVAVEAEAQAELKNGRTYHNTYHFLFLFRNGKIYHAKEYNDSAHAAAAFAGFEFL